MRDVIEQQLERLFTRFEFNDGFESDIIAAKTWAAQWWARFVLDDRLVGMEQFEVLEIETADLETAGQAVADAILSTKRRRILLIQLLDEGGDPQRWQPFFRRLNEVRNAVIREFVGNLVLLVAPRLLRELVGDAPDLWSVSAVISVGQTEPAELVDAMARRYPVLHRLTWMSSEEIAALLHKHHRAAFTEVIEKTDDRPLRGRRAFELIGSKIDAPALSRHTCGGLRISYVQQNLLAVIFAGSKWLTILSEDPEAPPRKESMSSDGLGGVLYPGPFGPHDLEGLIHERQSIHNPIVSCCVIPTGARIDLAELFARENFDLLITISRGRGWSIESATSTQAPKLCVAKGTAIQIVDGKAIVRRQLQRVSRSVSHQRWIAGTGPHQPWLPGIDPEILGVVPLYRA